MTLPTIKIMPFTLVAMVTNFIHLRPKYTVFELEKKVNSKSQDRLIYKFSRYFTHNIHSTNIDVHGARKNLNVLVHFKAGGSKMAKISKF